MTKMMNPRLAPPMPVQVTDFNGSVAPSLSVGSIRKALDFSLSHHEVKKNPSVQILVEEKLQELQSLADTDRIPAQSIPEFINKLSNKTSYYFFPLEFVSQIDFIAVPVFRYILNSSVSTLDFIRLLSRYITISTAIFKFESIIDEEFIHIQVQAVSPKNTTTQQYEGMLFTWFRLLKLAEGPQQIQINFKHKAKVPNLEIYQSLFGRTPKFNQESYSLSFNRKWANRRIGLGGDQSVLDNISALERIRTEAFALPFPNRVTTLIEEALIFGEPTRQQIAELLGISVRTLQRHLEKDGYTYKSLLSSTRKNLCEHYLKNKTLSCSDLAFLLGYRDPSQFFKAFKNWFGKTPTQYRSSLLD